MIATALARGCASFLALSICTSAALAAGGPAVSHFTLANGLEVVVIPDRRAPVVTHMVWYRVGSADETAGKTGLAHFLEHLRFKGTEKKPGNLFSQTVATIGGQENAFTSSDYTGYFQRVPKERLKLLMEFESDRMTGLVLTDAVVKPELDVVLEEENSRVANNPGARLSQQVTAALYLNHPYGRPVIGWRNEIEKLTRADALEFYKRFYTPNNAILIVAGDVDAGEVKTMVDETYGKVARTTEIAPRQRPMEPEQVAPRTVTFADPRVTQPSVQRQYLVPSSTTAAPGESEALDVLAHVLGGGQNSRLYRALVLDKKIALSSSAWYQGTALDYGTMGVSGVPKEGVTLAQVEDAIDGILAEVIANGVTDEEMKRSKDRLVADAVYAQDSQSTLARWYGAALTTGLTVEAVKAWPDRIKAVTTTAIKDAAGKWFDKRRSVTGYLIKDAPRPGEKRS